MEELNSSYHKLEVNMMQTSRPSACRSFLDSQKIFLEYLDGTRNILTTNQFVLFRHHSKPAK